MGKNSKKMNKKKNQQTIKANGQQMLDLKSILKQQMNDMAYADALDTLAQLIELKCYEPDVIYQGAQAYFLMGDYERAAAWVNNTLHYAPRHVEARLLLAKICLLEDRVDDAMALYTFVLQNYQNVLTDVQREDIKEGADYIRRTDNVWLTDNYPLIANLWSEENREMVYETVHNGQSKDEIDDIDKIIKQVIDKDISLKEKVKLLNTFAGGFFTSHDYVRTQKLLKKALELDAYNNRTLANIAILTKAQGDMDKALTYVTKMSEIDFLILQKIME